MGLDGVKVGDTIYVSRHLTSHMTAKVVKKVTPTGLVRTEDDCLYYSDGSPRKSPYAHEGRAYMADDPLSVAYIEKSLMTQRVVHIKTIIDGMHRGGSFSLSVYSDLLKVLEGDQADAG